MENHCFKGGYVLIIDFHSHLGDIMHLQGGTLIDERGVKKHFWPDPLSISEAQLHKGTELVKAVFPLLAPWFSRAEQARNMTATLENMRNTMDQVGITYTVVLPIHPYLTFEDVRLAALKDKGIIPFTTIDFTASAKRVAETLAEEVRAGARGLKLHPIIQNLPLADPKTLAAVEAFAPYALPVMVHCGSNNYRVGLERKYEHPENGDPRHLQELASAFPKVNFIAGHAGLLELEVATEALSGLPNVWVDVSFQSAKRIRALVKAFGRERVLLGSDWPWGSRATAVACARDACAGDQDLEEKLLFKNALVLLGSKTAATLA